MHVGESLLAAMTCLAIIIGPAQAWAGGPAGASGASGAPKPSSLSADTCRKLLPSRNRASSNYREYYDKFVSDICGADPAQDVRWQSCILDRMRNGSTAPDDISVAYNQCNPPYRACVADMTRRAPGFHELDVTFCTETGSTTDWTPAEKDCVIGYAKKDHYWNNADNIDPILGLCAAPAQECVQDFLSKGTFKRSHEFLTRISAICRRPVEDIPSDYRACMLEDFQAGRFLDDPSSSYHLCDPSLRAKRECVRTNFTSADLVQAMPTSGTKARIDISAKLCDIRNDKARKCLLKEIAQDRPYEEATAVCKFNEGDVRHCLRDFFGGNGIFGSRRWHSSIDEEAVVGEALCSISDLTDRQCVFDVFSDRVRSLAYHASLAGAQMWCADRSKAQQTCIDSLKPKNTNFDYDLVARAAARTICGITNVPIRECVLKHFPTLPSYPDDIDPVAAACTTQAMNRLLTDPTANNAKDCK